MASKDEDNTLHDKEIAANNHSQNVHETTACKGKQCESKMFLNLYLLGERQIFSFLSHSWAKSGKDSSLQLSAPQKRF